jgi:hypothetical protein
MLEALDESIATGAKYASLHNGYHASGAGGTELNGGAPAYARVPVTWNPASGGAKSTTGNMPFNVGAGSSVRFVGFWDAATAGSFLGMSPNGGGMLQAFVVPDATADILECVAHGFSIGDTVVPWQVPGDPLPAPLVEGNVYFIIATNFSTDDLRLSLTSGGPPIDITTLGAGYLQRIVVEVFGSQGTHTVTAITMTMD